MDAFGDLFSNLGLYGAEWEVNFSILLLDANHIYN
jgi:hypothetical protein